MKIGFGDFAGITIRQKQSSSVKPVNFCFDMNECWKQQRDSS